MIEPFAEDDGAGAKQGALRGISLAQARNFDGTRRFLHSVSLAQIAAGWY
jgi:hypothetical protein